MTKVAKQSVIITGFIWHVINNNNKKTFFKLNEKVHLATEKAAPDDHLFMYFVIIAIGRPETEEQISVAE
jgi:hypothetical protein